MGNVTVDPLTLAAPVLRPEIAEILDFESGEFLDAAGYIAGKRYDRLVAERVDIREGLANNPRFGCALCSTPVYLVASGRKRFFFRHRREDGSCPSITRSELSRAEIQALKYDGQRESLAHLRIKERIVRSPFLRSLEWRDRIGTAVEVCQGSGEPAPTRCASHDGVWPCRVRGAIVDHLSRCRCRSKSILSG
ncbi:hypothetical protein DSM25558_4852 [Agrobacterium sp. DSM 25558]|nr:hypothetical protein DSM25558_4852 [Agrobacterium sp. DSM 25558]